MHTAAPPIKAGSEPLNPADCRGVPNDQAGDLEKMLALAALMREEGYSRADIIRHFLALNRRLPKPLPAFSPGGLAESLDGLLRGGVSHG